MTHEDLKDIIQRVVRKMKDTDESAVAACIYGDDETCAKDDVICDVCDTCDVTTYYAVGEED